MGGMYYRGDRDEERNKCNERVKNEAEDGPQIIKPIFHSSSSESAAQRDEEEKKTTSS